MAFLRETISLEELDQLSPQIYRFKGIDTSPLAKWLSPKWDSLLRMMFPPTVAPNVLTVGGLLLLVVNFILVCYVRPISETGYSDIALRLLWLVCAFNCFWGYALDCMDGKQARRTGTSSALGELIDHGCDAFSIWTITFSLGVLTQYADDGPIGPGWTMVMWMLLSLAGFFFAHWESYNTHQFYLPWSFDVGEISVVVCFLASATFGHEMWLTPVPQLNWLVSGIQLRGLLATSTVGFVIFDGFRTAYSVSQVARRTGDWARAFAPLTYLFSTFGSVVIFAAALGARLLHTHIHLVVVVLGFDFCNVVTRLVLAHVAERPLRANYAALLPLWVGAFFLFVDNVTGFAILSPLQHIHLQIAFAGVCHMDFAISAVRAFCYRFNIRCFHIVPARGAK